MVVEDHIEEDENVELEEEHDEEIEKMVDMKIMRAWNLLVLLPKAPRIRPCWWTPPAESTIKVNCDGLAVWNPRPAGIRSTFRDASVYYCIYLTLSSAGSHVSFVDDASTKVGGGKDGRLWKQMETDMKKMAVEIAEIRSLELN
ncbi:hypothetical protein IFM89_016731 [Coptis chinensis]|uniref:Uncharacterized protein n=1 Tax=Coptis chinensis TaxID=261450 RepID=A0A835IRB0_9MAGN|nr:hypothetical protein IFM89_016731 [Coptis chinensis]